MLNFEISLMSNLVALHKIYCCISKMWILHLQAVLVHPSLRPSHRSQGAQVVQEGGPQTVLLGDPAVQGGHEVLEGPGQRKGNISH